MLCLRWETLHAETLTIANTGLLDAMRAAAVLPSTAIASTFAVRCFSYISGLAQVKIRFGLPGSTVPGSNGIDFPPLTAAGQTWFATQGFGIGFAFPSAPGSAPAILPPVVQVFLTTSVAPVLVRLTYSVLVAAV